MRLRTTTSGSGCGGGGGSRCCRQPGGGVEEVIQLLLLLLLLLEPLLQYSDLGVHLKLLPRDQVLMRLQQRLGRPE
jgi:hypothetical protein